MQHHTLFCLFLAVSPTIITAQTAPAAPAHGVLIDAKAPVATISPRSDGHAANAYELQARTPADDGSGDIPFDYPWQKPFRAECPERYGYPKLECDVCGGEDPERPGYCTGSGAWRPECLCTNNKAGDVITTLVTTTVGKDVATGTFELETLTKYARVRQKVTVTTTGTVTQSGESVVETAAVVVFAGGVAWFLADASGGAAAVAALEAPQTAQDHEDDKTCPNPEKKCQDCNGAEGLCRSRGDFGCACEEEDQCPKDGDEDQPQCTDDGCNPDGEGNCTGGDHKGCQCKKMDCPDLKEWTFFCSDCGGKGEDGKCKGDPGDDNVWKGCECMDEPDWAAQPSALTRQNVKEHRQALANLPEKSKSAPLPQPSCGTEVIGMYRNVFEPDIYAKFCKTIDNGDRKKALSQTVDSYGDVVPSKKRSVEKNSLDKRTPPPDPSYYKGWTIDLEWTGGDGTCNNGCAESYAALAQDYKCGSQGGEGNRMVAEGKLDTGCGTYSFKINKPTDDGDDGDDTGTPKKPTKCNPHSGAYRAFSRDAAAAQIQKVCQDLHDAKVVLSQTGDSLPPLTNPYQKDSQVTDKNLSDGGSTFVVGPNWALAGCDDTNNPVDVDFGAMSVDECTAHFFPAMDDCDTSNENGDTFWKWGGQAYGSCAFWNIAAQV